MTMYEMEDDFFTSENPNIKKMVAVFKEMLRNVTLAQAEIDHKADILEPQKERYIEAGLEDAWYSQWNDLVESWHRLEKRRLFWDNLHFLATNAESDFREQLERARAQNPDIAGELDSVLKDSA